MEKRFFLAFIITFIFLIVWSRFAPQAPKPVLSPQEQEAPDARETTLDTKKTQKAQEEMEVPYEQDEAELPQVTIGEFIITYSTSGGYIKKISMAKTDSELPLADIGFMPEDKNREFTPRISKNKIEFTDTQGAKKEFLFDGYIVTLRTKLSTDQPVVLFSKPLSSKMLDLNKRYQEVFYSHNKAIKRAAPHKMKPAILENVDFAGFRGRYYCLSLLKGDYAIKWAKTNDKLYLYLVSSSAEVSLYIGPQTVKNLQPYDLQGIIYYGFFPRHKFDNDKSSLFSLCLNKKLGVEHYWVFSSYLFCSFPFYCKKHESNAQNPAGPTGA